MPKLFVTSDIHSYFKPFKESLDKAGFDPNDKDHWLIVCGDVFDRGPDSVELLHYLMSLDRKVLVRGNHDSLLETLCMRGFPYSHDKHNGTTRTIRDISGKYSAHDFAGACEITYNKLARYRELLVNYFETQNYIFVHSWIPTYIGYEGKTHSFCEGWRYATDNEWEDAMWGNPFELANQDLNKTGKIIVFGHFHTSYQWSKDGKCSEFGVDADFNPYYGRDFIGIDGCTAHTGEVNVILLEDDFLAE